MEYFHEIITPEAEMPVKIFLNSVRNVQRHWHNSLEITLVLDGEITQYFNNNEILLKKDDFIIVNSNQVHAFHGGGEDNLLLTLQLPKKYLANIDIDIEKTEFIVPKVSSQTTYVYKTIRSLMAEIALTNIQKEKFYIVKTGELVYNLIYLISYYFAKTKKENENTNEDLDRLSLAINEIQKNYSSNLTLNDVAKVQGLSRNYFSHFFKKHMGLTFLEYLSGVRLEHATKDIVLSKKTITDISLDNGFPNSKSFTKIFKESYGMTPSQYRHTQSKADKLKNNSSTTSYFDIEGINKKEFLYQYLIRPKDIKNLPVATHLISRRINTKLKGIKRSKNPLSLITFGRASTGLKADLQKQIRETQEEIGFKYVRFHGILDDDMGIYSEDSEGNPIYNFLQINSLMDFLMEVKLKPLLEIAFMPSLLAKKKKTLWDGKSYASMPKDISRWNELIKKLMENFVERYGKKQVSSWLFEVWNEPEYSGIMWNGTKEDFFTLWENTYKTIKSVNKSFQVGGPSIMISTVWDNNWFSKFAYHTKITGTEPDFLTFHSYPLEGLNFATTENLAYFVDKNNIELKSILEKMDSILKDNSIEISKDSSFLKMSVDRAKNTLKNYNWDQLPIFLTEWNSTTWQRDLTNDTVYQSAFIVKNIMENIEELSGFGYWTLSDCMEELPPSSDIFHGGFGLMTTEGIKKASYYGFDFLKNLGEDILEQGDNYSVFRNANGDIQLLLYNYIHLNNLYRGFDTSNISKQERYNVFENSQKIQMDFSLTMESNQEFLIRKQILSRDSGSAFDEWVKMGAKNHLSKDDVKNLKMYSVPKIIYENITSSSNLDISHVLSPHEVCLIEITKKQ